MRAPHVAPGGRNREKAAGHSSGRVQPTPRKIGLLAQLRNKRHAIDPSITPETVIAMDPALYVLVAATRSRAKPARDSRPG
jgi:hypothetical protein